MPLLGPQLQLVLLLRWQSTVVGHGSLHTLRPNAWQQGVSLMARQGWLPATLTVAMMLALELALEQQLALGL